MTERLKLIALWGLFLASVPALGEIKVKVAEPLRFRNINSTEIGPNKVIAVGAIEVYTEEEEDLGKKIGFQFPPYMLMTNRRKWIKVEKVGMELKEQEIILEKKREFLKIYAVLDRRELDRGEPIDVIEGEYAGVLPITVAEYKKVMTGGVDSEKNKEIQTLPVFPDEEGGAPAPPSPDGLWEGKPQV